MLSQCICYTLETYQILSPVLFQQSLYFPLLIHLFTCIITLTQSVRASTLIHAVVLCESAQRYRALMVILQSHRTQNMILRCYPTVSAIYFRDIPNLVSCAFSTIPIFPLLNSQNFLFTCLCSFFTCLEESGALLRPKNGYLVGLKCARRTRARARRAQALGARRSSCIIFVVYM